ncbi:hypothetical protein [Pseudooceanicola onchidii]|uniref:hypothetical protein n=1 Tax=Pseudooceanicola onchidii TaxID=2562279 RepID=UPI0010A9DAB0|nr:hypothetical protein [Pseudooceanicola onchidii]
MDDSIQTSAEAEEADALPRRHEALRDGTTPLPNHVTEKPTKSKSPAEWAYERLILYIQSFEEGLDADQEVAMGFVGNDTGVLRIEGMGFFDPDILTFYGTDTQGVRTQLVQHVSQLSVALRAMPKMPERKEPNRIGFRLQRDLENSTTTDPKA